MRGPAVVDLVHPVSEVGEQPSIRLGSSRRGSQTLVGVAGARRPPRRSTGARLFITAGSPKSAQECVGEAAFPELACAVPELQRGPRRDGQEVDARSFPSLPVGRARKREHRQSLDIVERFDALGDELAQVLTRDRAVGADVDDVVSLIAAAAGGGR